MQGLLSSQPAAGAGAFGTHWHSPEDGCTQEPAPLHQSSVQISPSSAQGVPLEALAFTQPEPGLQESLVQAFPSLQLGGELPTQEPPEQISLVVQALPSLQALVLAGCVQEPPEQTSLVQPLPSSAQASVLGALTHAPKPLQESFVQGLLSLQAGSLVLGTHEHRLLVFTQPDPGLQESEVQILPSLQLGATPPTQEPPEQVSFVVQALPSLQALALLV